MKKLLSTLSIIAIIASSTATLAGNIATVDIKRIVEESSAAKNITKQLKKQTDEYQEEVTKEESKLQKEEKELASERTILSKDVFEEKAKDFRTRVLKFQRSVQTKRALLENARVKAFKKVEQNTLDIVKGLAKDKGFKVAIPKASLLYSEENLDISDEVLKKLNKKLPKVKIKIEE